MHCNTHRFQRTNISNIKFDFFCILRILYLIFITHIVLFFFTTRKDANLTYIYGQKPFNIALPNEPIPPVIIKTFPSNNNIFLISFNYVFYYVFAKMLFVFFNYLMDYHLCFIFLILVSSKRKKQKRKGNYKNKTAN